MNISTLGPLIDTNPPPDPMSLIARALRMEVDRIAKAQVVPCDPNRPLSIDNFPPELISQIADRVNKMTSRLAFNGKEAAEVCGMDYSTLWRHKSAGRIKVSWNGLYPLAEIQRFLESGIKINNLKLRRKNEFTQRGPVKLG